MSSHEDIDGLVPLVLGALAEILDTTVDELPGGVEGLLLNYGIACHSEGWDRAHDEPTVPRMKTNPGFPAVLPVGVGREKDEDEQR